MENLKPGSQILKTRLPIEILNAGSYKVVLDGGIHKTQWLYNPVHNPEISITFSISENLSNSPFWIHKRQGLLAPILNWQVT